jgi:hypothetical protein
MCRLPALLLLLLLAHPLRIRPLLKLPVQDLHQTIQTMHPPKEQQKQTAMTQRYGSSG